MQRNEIVAAVERMAPSYSIDPALVTAIIETESAFHVDAVSPKGAMGLMQLMPDTAARFGVTDSFDPIENLRGGMSYLRTLLRLFGGDVALSVAAYNAGESAVQRHVQGEPLSQETLDYVAKLRRLYPADHHPIPNVTRVGSLPAVVYRKTATNGRLTVERTPFGVTIYRHFGP
jgi:soluble lytic murein transglycosylase-like protein